MSDTLVVIPSYRERENLEKLIPMVMDLDIDVDVLVVDDYSGDGTDELLGKMSRIFEGVQYIIRRDRRGYASALVDGYRYGLEHGYKYIAQMDADLQHDPKYLPNLTREIRGGAGLVIASRYIEGGGIVGWPLHRRIISRGANLYARLVLGIPAKDITSGYRIFSREALEAIIDSIPSVEGFFIQIETAYKVHRRGFQIMETPFVFRPRELGESKLSSGMILEFFINVLRLRFNRGWR